MGYDIRIGNAVPFHSKEYGELYAKWTVQRDSHAFAPTFLNDEMTGSSNCRSPSYGAWAEFSRKMGLYDFFYDDTEGLLRQHPGCQMITQEHLDQVQAALIRYQGSTDKKPGFYGWDDLDTGEYDGHLARIIWLEWWMRWALANCETPAIENT